MKNVILAMFGDKGNDLLSSAVESIYTLKRHKGYLELQKLQFQKTSKPQENIYSSSSILDAIGPKNGTSHLHIDAGSVSLLRKRLRYNVPVKCVRINIRLESQITNQPKIGYKYNPTKKGRPGEY